MNHYSAKPHRPHNSHKSQQSHPQKSHSQHPLPSQLAHHIQEASLPNTPHFHLIQGGRGTLLFLPDRSRLVPLSSEQADRFRDLLSGDNESLIQLELAAMGYSGPPAIDDQPLQDPPLHALSLAIAQKCNMACSYCYAEQGSFGGPQTSMSLETAKQAIDLLFQNKQPGDRVNLAFMGGEPLTNRPHLVEATHYASQQAQQYGLHLALSLTTNGTLIQPQDVDFLEEFGFAVTISLDGIGETHDRLRPMKNGQGSYQRILQRIRPLLARQSKMQVTARVTVTPENMSLVSLLDDLIALGFHSVGFSPLLNSSSGKGEMTPENLQQLLEAMIECGLRFETHVLKGQRYPFLNMVNALKEIGKRTHRPYPCGAGAGYLGVSAEGQLAACHRFVNEPEGHMGDLENGINPTLQNTWLNERHVHRQEPCSTCWARYLCSGSCHHEVLHRERTACHYIRGWLHYTLQAYDRLQRYAPLWNT